MSREQPTVWRSPTFSDDDGPVTHNMWLFQLYIYSIKDFSLVVHRNVSNLVKNAELNHFQPHVHTTVTKLNFGEYKWKKKAENKEHHERQTCWIMNIEDVSKGWGGAKYQMGSPYLLCLFNANTDQSYLDLNCPAGH